MKDNRPVGGRLAVNFRDLRLPVSDACALEILIGLGFIIITVDIVERASYLIGRARYCRGAKPSQAPDTVDCSSFTKWAYGQAGYWLPRYSVDQRSAGRPVVLPVRGDLVFRSGWKDWWINDPEDGVGHVGIYTGFHTVIHAANSRRGVVEDSLEDFVQSSKLFRGYRRFTPLGRPMLTLQIPADREIESSFQLRWLILQKL